MTTHQLTERLIVRNWPPLYGALMCATWLCVGSCNLVAVCYVVMWWLMLAGVIVAGRQHLLDMGPLGLYRLHGPEDLDLSLIHI